MSRGGYAPCDSISPSPNLYSKTLKNLHCLTTLVLCLSQNNIGILGVEYLIKSIGSITEMRVLKILLFNNNINDLYMSLFSPLSNLISLKEFELDLSNNCLKDTDMHFCLDFIIFLINLETLNLDLSYNKISFKGGIVIRNIIKKIKVKKTFNLFLNENRFGKKSFEKFFDCVKQLKNVILIFDEKFEKYIKIQKKIYK